MYDFPWCSGVFIQPVFTVHPIKDAQDAASGMELCVNLIMASGASAEVKIKQGNDVFNKMQPFLLPIKTNGTDVFSLLDLSVYLLL